MHYFYSKLLRNKRVSQMVPFNVCSNQLCNIPRDENWRICFSSASLVWLGDFLKKVRIFFFFCLKNACGIFILKYNLKGQRYVLNLSDSSSNHLGELPIDLSHNLCNSRPTHIPKRFYNSVVNKIRNRTSSTHVQFWRLK